MAKPRSKEPAHRAAHQLKALAPEKTATYKNSLEIAQTTSHVSALPKAPGLSLAELKQQIEEWERNYNELEAERDRLQERLEEKPAETKGPTVYELQERLDTLEEENEKLTQQIDDLTENLQAINDLACEANDAILTRVDIVGKIREIHEISYLDDDGEGEDTEK